MSLFKKISLWLIFYSTFGFAGGGYFLLFLIVPFEEWLVNIGSSQAQIDNILKYFVFGWFIFGTIVSIIYYKLLLNKKKRHVIAYILVTLTVISAGYVYYLFTNANTSLISKIQGEVVEVGERFTFGPYPDIENIKDLKEKGYDGIITLLSPTIIFEKQLLDKEIKNGEEIGINIYSFPMLPWVGDNRRSIQGIKQLINEDSTKRYYIHCYLGKHRVDLIKQIIMAETGEETKKRLTHLPTNFERGNVYTFEQEKVILGPYPTEEEWLILFRHQVKEIISLLPTNSVYYEKEKKIADENDIKLTSIPLSIVEPDPETIWKIVDYVKELDHKVYIHGYNSKGNVLAIEFALNKGILPFQSHLIPTNFVEGDLYKIGNWMVIGPYPSNYEISRLTRSGIKTYVSLWNPEQSEYLEKNELVKFKMSELGLDFVNRPFSDDTLNVDKLFELATELENKNSSLYVFGLNPSQSKLLYQILQGRNYGFDISIENFILENGTITLVERDLIIGPILTKSEWKQLIFEKGIKRVVMINAPSIYTNQDIEGQNKYVISNNIKLEVIDMFEDYGEKLITILKEKKETTYVIVPNEFKEVVHQMIIDSN